MSRGQKVEGAQLPLALLLLPALQQVQQLFLLQALLRGWLLHWQGATALALPSVPLLCLMLCLMRLSVLCRLLQLLRLLAEPAPCSVWWPGRWMLWLMLLSRRQQQHGAFPASCCQLHAALLLQQWMQQPCQQHEHLAGLLHAEHLLPQQLLTV
jgi:hypothetical protein